MMSVATLSSSAPLPAAADAGPPLDAVARKLSEGPGWVGWREGTLTRAVELESLFTWVKDNPRGESDGALLAAIPRHLQAAREAAAAAKPWPMKFFRTGPLIERASSNLDATEALILNVARADYILGQMPSLLRHVQCHLLPSDPRRQELERIAQKVGVKDPDHPLSLNAKEGDALNKEDARQRKLSVVDAERGEIVTAVRGASSAALREQVRLHSFRNVVVLTALLMTVLAVGVAVTGYIHKDWIPLCFAPQVSGDSVIVVCPTTQSAPQPAAEVQDIDDTVNATATPHDLLIVELVGLTAAAVAAAAAIRRIRGSAERVWLPVALAALKLPTGAITAFLGLLLMRGQFVPGLSALDTSAQILAWALVFGYAQQLFTRFVDQQGQTVLDNVHSAGRSTPTPSPP